MKRFSFSHRDQAGSVLLEGLIAILLFSIGILAIVGMQAAAIRASSEAKYRSDASILVDQLIGQMWAGNRNPAALQTSFQGGAGNDGTAYSAWYADVQAELPGANANPPLVNVNAATGAVGITVWWLAPGEPSGTAPHQYSVVTQIGG